MNILQTNTQSQLETYLVVMASHELDPSEPYPVPADTQVLEMPYPADIEVTTIKQESPRPLGGG